MDIDSFRREYILGGLSLEQLAPDPLVQFQHWLGQAVEANFPDPTAMTVATVSADGQPSQRVVLLKQVDEQGFVFFTNYGSRKAREIAGNEKVSLHFPWHGLDRQVKICGRAEKIAKAESLRYFLSRPKESRLAAWASKQSSPLSSRDMLMQQVESMKRKFSQGEIPLPDFWGGIRVRPHQMEFWQGGKHRLHDCFQYNLDTAGGWSLQRLAP